MIPSLTWIPVGQTTLVAGFSISGIHFVAENSDGRVSSFAINPGLPVEHGMQEPLTDSQAAADYAEWTPRQRGTFLQWWSEGRPPRVDDSLTRSFCRVAFANYEIRLLGGDMDGLLRLAIGDLQKNHETILFRVGLSRKLNQVVQFAAFCRGVDHHMAAINTLRRLPGFPWSKPETSLLMTGFLQSAKPLKPNSAILVAWATLTADEQSAIAAQWERMYERFEKEFKKLFPAGLVLTRPAATRPFAYEPSHSAVTRVLPADMRLSLDLPDFYSDEQLTPLLSLFRSVFGLLTDSQKARLFFTKFKIDEAIDEAIDALSKLCCWSIIRTKEAIGTAVHLGRRQPEALQDLHPPCDVPDWLRAQLFMQAQDGLTLREQLPTDFEIICDWWDSARAAKAIEEASSESGVDLTAASPIALASRTSY